MKLGSLIFIVFGAPRYGWRGLSARSMQTEEPSAPSSHFPPLRQKRLPLTSAAKHLKCQETTWRSRQGTPYTAYGHRECFALTMGSPPRACPARPPALRGALLLYKIIAGAWSLGLFIVFLGFILTVFYPNFLHIE